MDSSLFRSQPPTSGPNMRKVPFSHQLQTSDEDFVDHLNVPGAAGKQLAAARKAGDLAQMHRIVAEHFRTRKSPAWSFWSHGSPWHETDAVGPVIEKANNLLNHR